VNSRGFQDRLARRVRKAGLTVAEDLAEQLEVYYRLLSRWNSKINLTGLDLEGPEALDRLLVEPLVAARYVRSDTRRAIDIGTGGGSPAIPLALSIPELHLLMVEAKTRKSVFLREVLRALTLDRCDVVTTRFETLLAKPELHEAHDLLTSRAVRIEPKVLMGLQAFVKPMGEIFLFRTTADVGAPTLTPPLRWRATHTLLEARGSRLVVLRKHPPGREPTFHVKHLDEDLKAT